MTIVYLESLGTQELKPKTILRNVDVKGVIAYFGYLESVNCEVKFSGKSMWDCILSNNIKANKSLSLQAIEF